ncbi:MAG: alpha/beta hydrolase domain-containing protein, partial [SAR202 cluster bacterium]|nr:alpha/beta hydrolase domain-containing protein [SAR202 cluster bacterium]
PSTTHCHLPGGFKPGWIYELVYTAKNPKVQGLGLTGVRDLISFLLHEDADIDGTPNPLRQNGARMDKAYGWGRSQSGRFLREFVYQGYNEDSQGRTVFDAISPHVSGGGRVVLNYRFAQPGRYPRPHDDHLYPSDSFPFAYPVITDPLTGNTDGILKRPDSDPLVIHTQTSSEYWTRRGSLVHTDSMGNDIPDHPKTRVFHFSGSQHNADPLGGNPNAENARHPSNPLNTTPLLRAMLDSLDAWATDATPPPESMAPRRSDETGVPADVASRVFPKIPKVEHPENANRLFVQDHGPDFDSGIVANEPPVVDRSREYAVLIPQVDSDGNEIPGIRTPHVQVPLATYTGWNYRPTGSAGQAIAGTIGGHHPLPITKADRDETGDPRLSIEQRYGSKARYVRLIALSAQKMVEQRLLLEEDADRYVALAMGQDFGSIE